MLGVFEMNIADTTLSYTKGLRRPKFTVRDGTAFPLDRDGLIAFSFYAHLEDTVELLNQSNHDFSAITPVHIAIFSNPARFDLGFSYHSKNAAYVPSVHHFIILSDLRERRFHWLLTKVWWS